ncbi:MAG: hypothetical protein IKW89_06215 [Bacteroidales bacterium]|nr:hypothetical protein [Bacteroidales bacterium]
MSKRLSRIILLVIVVLQCGVMLFWASRKVYYYIDEWYTFEYAQSINHREGNIEYMPLSPKWKNNQWMDVGDLKTRFTLEKGESVLDIPFSKSIGVFFKDKNYMWIINFLETVFGKDEAPKWICILFNIAILALTQFLLFFFMAGCLGIDRRSALLAVAMWGFCPLVLGLAVFCRFYAWTMLLFLVTIVLHRIMWDSSSHMRNIVCEIAAMLALYLAFRNSELMFVLGGSLFLFFTIALVVRKRYVQSIYYFLPVVGAALLMPHAIKFIKVVLHPAEHLAIYHGGMRSLVSKHVKFMLTSSWADKTDALFNSVKQFGDSVFGSPVLLIIAVVCLIVLFVTVVTAKKKIPRRFDGFVLVLLGMAVVFWIFCGICGIAKSRYLSFMFLLGAILFWTVFDKLVRGHRAEGLIRKAALCLVLAVAVLPFFRKNIDYVYDGWQPVFEKLGKYKGTDALVDYSSLFVLYESVDFLDPSTRIYPLKSYSPNDSFYNHFGMTLPDLPRTFLFWVDNTMTPMNDLMRIRHQGYKEVDIIEWGVTTVYVFEEKTKK